MDSKIAIIGMACHVPEADTPYAFWNNLIQGIESIKTFTDEELKEADIPDYILNMPQYVKRGATIKDIEYFDADFFNYTPKDAEITDPQHRMFLECAWEALEDAACIKDIDRYIVGVYASSCMSNYFLNIYSNEDSARRLGHIQIGIGNEKDFLASKVAFKLGLKGPAINIQTACSSSLVAVHIASQSLLNGECDIALAGGVTVRSEQVAGYFYQKEGMASPDGHCRVFDADSKGTVFGNGLGIVVLKRLTDAVRDRDNILAVICGTAVNNDGLEKAGYTAPSPTGQACVINEALAVAGMTPKDISYIETHGTGTELGDVVEIKALKEVFMEDGYKPQSCAIGSVKPNIGHLDIAAGIVGLIKTTLALKHNIIPPCINHVKPNTQISLETSPFFVNTKPLLWRQISGLLKAGVSSFGIGGTNAHVILEEAPLCSPSTLHKKYYTFIFSAKTEKSLNNILGKMAVYFRQNPHLNPADVAFTLQIGRADFIYRKMFVCTSLNDAIYHLRKRDKYLSQYRDEFLGTAFLFSQQDENIQAMGYELYQSDELFATKVDSYLCLFQDSTKENNYKKIIFPKLYYSERPEQEPFNVELSAFVLGNALADYMVELKIKPDLIIAAGTGIYAAVYQAGFISISSLTKILFLKHRWYKAENEQKKYFEKELSDFLNTVNIESNETQVIFNKVAITEESLRRAKFWLYNTEKSLEVEGDFLEPVKGKARIIIEIGMESEYLKSIKKEADNINEHFIHLLPHCRNNESAEYFLNKALGDIWLRGGAIDWRKLYIDENSRRISLPTYSFNRERYWVKKRKPSSDNNILEATSKKNIKDWFYRPVWKQYGDVCVHTVDESLRYNYVIFADPWGAGDRIKQALASKGHTVYSVKTDTQFAKVNQYEYSINPARLVHYEHLFSDIQKTKEHPLRIIHMWSLQPVDQNQVVEDAEKKQTLKFYSFLNIGKCLSMAGVKQQTQLYVLTSGYQPVFGNENLIPDNATVIGAVNVIPQEFTNVKCSLIDIINTDLFNNEGCCFELLLEELVKPSPERILAIRGRYKWVQLFEPVPVANREVCGNNLIKNGTYIIFGGLGDIGLTFAEFLSQNNCVSLILVGHSEFPSKDHWKKYMEEPRKSTKVSNRIRRLILIENSGVQVHILQADVSDKNQMSGLFKAIDERFNEIQGIIYSVGAIVNDFYSHSISNITREMCEAEFCARIEGVQILEEEIRHRNIEFCVLNSSISAVLGGIGLVAYSAANHFMDVFAQKMNLSGSKTKWMSVNWDAWNFTDDESSIEGKTNRRLAGLIQPEEGQSAFGYLLALSNSADRIVVSTMNLDYRLTMWLNTPNKKDDNRDAFNTQNTSIGKILTDTIKGTMGIKKIGPEDNFFELGITSIDIVAMNDILQNKINKPILVSSWFQYPTMNKLVGYLNEEKDTISVESGSFDRSKILNKGLNTLKTLKQKRKGV